MNIEITQLPEEKVWHDAFKRYTMTYPKGYPVTVRRITNCEDCGIEIGGFFGNKVYRYHGTEKCKACGEKDEPASKMCIAQTGMTPIEYQREHKRAWNE